ncbi:prolipoprotein diacylglyceryl transferase [Lysinibacter cavernae]|nr:prolipoprotein diacylglyceryl transferase [Lysinibacter cavernae]
MSGILPASIPSPEVSSFSIPLPWGGELPIHFYALCILAGIIAAAIITNHRLTKRGGESWVTLDFAFWTVILGMIGARTYHVLTHTNDYFYEGADYWKVVMINEGGIAIFGALLGGAVGTLIACRITGIRFWSFADALAPGLLVAQAFGRLGNWFNHELFGSPTNLPWGLEIEKTNSAFPIGLPEGTLFHPTFLYEIIWNLVGLAIILILERKLRTRWGMTFAMYLIWYGIGRAWLETLRVDPIGSFLGLRYNMWTALLAVVVGIVIILIQRKEHPGLENDVYRPGRGPKYVSDDVLSEDEKTHFILGRAHTDEDESEPLPEAATSERSATQ